MSTDNQITLANVDELVVLELSECPSWKEEYLSGAVKKLKGFVVNSQYVGGPYKAFVLEVFRKYGVTVIAMQKVGMILVAI